MTPKVAMREAGIPAATQKAMRPFKNRNKMHKTSAMPPKPLTKSTFGLGVGTNFGLWAGYSSH